MNRAYFKTDRLIKQIKKIENELETLPEGSLIKRGTSFTHVSHKTEIGITKKSDYMRLLCRRRLLTAKRKQMKSNVVVFDKMNQKIQNATFAELIKSLPTAYQDLPADYFYHPSIKIWLEKEVPQRDTMTTPPNYVTTNGRHVHRKDEALIANVLESYNIPYRYEFPLTLKDKKIYPHFTILKPFTGEVIHWEHFGSLYKTEEVDEMNEKMLAYRNAGSKLLENVIYTFAPDIKDMENIKKIVEDVILA